MNEVEHFFDLEIKRAEGRIAHSEDFECFNGVEVGSKHAKELNQAHIRFCESAKRSLMPTIDKMDKQISEMQSHIDCLKAELAEVQMRKADLHTEPIKVADMLIDHSYSTGCLRQIAEHLLVYCNNAEVE